MQTAFFAGSFNPFTIGHADIVARGLKLFDKIIIGIGINIDKPDAESTARRRADEIRNCYAADERVEVSVYSGLTVDAAREHGAAVLLRGARSTIDFEYERNMADGNRLLAPDLETVILPARPELGCVSSTFVRDLYKHGHAVDSLCPPQASSNNQ